MCNFAGESERFLGEAIDNNNRTCYNTTCKIKLKGGQHASVLEVVVKMTKEWS